MIAVATLGSTRAGLSQFSAITNASIVDATASTPRANMTILIRGHVIADVFAAATKPLPAGATVLDARGKYVIPGLIDSHVHNATIEERPQNIREAILKNALMGGVTSVRDMGGRTSDVRAFAARAAADTTPWPRIYFSAIIAGPGGWFEGSRGRYMAEGGEPGHAALVRKVVTRDDIRPAITAAREAGATGIKLYNNIDPQLLPLIAAEARRQNLRVWSHLAVDPGKPSDLVRAGVNAVSHADQFLAEVLPWPRAGMPRDSVRALRHGAFATTRLDTLPLTKLIADMKAKDVAFDPTLYIMTPVPDSTGRIDEYAAALYAFATDMTRRANQAGVTIVAGTDDLARNSPNIHAELQLLVERAGLTPFEAIRSATLSAARVLGAQDSIGTIEAGKIADLVILDGNPLEDIANTLTVTTVIKGGRAYHRDAPLRIPPKARAPRKP
jgi:imidazolonepropionase-like amidohydrolase